MSKFRSLNRDRMTDEYNALRAHVTVDDFTVGQIHGLGNVLNGSYLKYEDIDMEKLGKQIKGLKSAIQSVETMGLEHDFIRGELKALEDTYNGVYSIENEAAKFALFSLSGPTAGVFVRIASSDGEVATKSIADASLLTAKQCEDFDLDYLNANEYLVIPISQAYLDALPFDMWDREPHIVNTTPDIDARQFVDRHPEMDFVILTPEGFMDEKYNLTRNTSRPKVRSFELDYANLYNQATLEKHGTQWILDKIYDANSLVIPVSKTQQQALEKLSEFSKETEPYGFFFEPIGDTQKREPLPELGDALDDLGNDISEELPFK